MKRFIFAAAAIGFLLLFVGCSDQGDEAIAGIGTIIYSDLEGGCWGINLDNGEQYEVRDLPQSYQQDGLRVRIAAKLSRGQAGWCSLEGFYVDIIEIHRI